LGQKSGRRRRFWGAIYTAFRAIGHFSCAAGDFWLLANWAFFKQKKKTNGKIDFNARNRVLYQTTASNNPDSSNAAF
jgi:hypothetical protein